MFWFAPEVSILSSKSRSRNRINNLCLLTHHNAAKFNQQRRVYRQDDLDRGAQQAGDPDGGHCDVNPREVDVSTMIEWPAYRQILIDGQS